ncbi:hypothetical protein DCS_00008 [Drechmeria coniospora]|uniref:Uncharacterized protein n=1 Tax=Drechmeria coniospora TaxID=98403 RepID=A0A151GP92_DRECN|nr:hypothetical protein DCS_00008 [Drechmeria coniospora]KYK58881.1 hypothetical protein DCS_00008 [Drechmeria coniospora]
MLASITTIVAVIAGLGLTAPTAQPEKRWNYGDMMAQAVADDAAVYGKANSDAWKWKPMPEYTKWNTNTNTNWNTQGQRKYNSPTVE